MSGKKIILLLLFAGARLVSGQVIYLSGAQIRFEKKVNYARVFNAGELPEELQRESAEGLVTYFDYVFERTRSLYKPEYTETGNKHVLLDVLPAADNTVFRDAGSGIETKEKKVYSKTYFIRDSLTDFKWTITDEKRNIAGFECRKAVGMLMDSIPVIAFYSEEFLTSGGPESFAGLPGMILGVAVPRLHTTWYAVNVETGKTEVNWNHATPADGKYMDRKIYLQAVRQEFKGDRSLIERFIGWVML